MALASSFASGLEVGIRDFTGFDINPLAVLICKVKFTQLNLRDLELAVKSLRESIYSLMANPYAVNSVKIERFANFEYWFSEKIALELQLIKNEIGKFDQEEIKNMMLTALSLTVRECSYVRNNEFKLYRMKEEAMLVFNPDVLAVFFKNIDSCVRTYEKFYYQKLQDASFDINNCTFQVNGEGYDVVLTSPPMEIAGQRWLMVNFLYLLMNVFSEMTAQENWIKG